MYLYDARVVPSSLLGTDGVTLDAWTISQTASGQPRLTLTLQGAGTGVTQYASVYVRKVAAGLPQAFPALVFSNDDNLRSSTRSASRLSLTKCWGSLRHPTILARLRQLESGNYGVHNFSSRLLADFGQPSR